MDKDLKQELKELTEIRGAVKFGVADLTPVKDFVVEQGGEYLEKFPRAIVFGFPLLNGVVESLNNEPSLQDLHSYNFHAYEVLNRMLDYLAYEIAEKLEQSSYLAYSVAASQKINKSTHQGVFSHKLAVNLSGAGWIGKNCLAVTNEFGPRIRWATVLTNAPLTTDDNKLEDGCGNCRVCKNVCPAKALTGNHFDPQRQRDYLLDPDKCEKYRDGLLANNGVRTCGLCMSKCPKGMKTKISK